FHDFLIDRGRVRVFQRLIASDRRNDKEGAGFDGKIAVSGVQTLDDLLGGGLKYGSSTLVMGPAGSGKSTISMQYVLSACRRGDRAVMYLFEEGRESLLRRAAGIQMNFPEYISKGRLKVDQIDPAQITPGEFADRVRAEVTQEKASIVVID